MTAKRRGSRTNWKKADAHVIDSREYDEIPELTKESMARGTYRIGERVVGKTEFAGAVKRALRRGRPKSPNPRKQIALRLPGETLARWKASGPGWQTRMAQLLTRRAP